MVKRFFTGCGRLPAMKRVLDRIPYGTLLPIAVLLAVAPVFPEPHLTEKVGMLLQGTLRRPLDIFDLLFHSVPLLILLLKALVDLSARRGKLDSEGGSSDGTG